MAKEKVKYDTPNDKSKKISLAEILEYFKKKWYWFAISVVCTCVLGFAYGKIKAPMYEVDANIRISQDESGGLLSLAGFTNLFGGGSNVDDEVFVVQSHSVLCQVVRNDSLFIDYYVKPNMFRTQVAYPSHPVDLIIPTGIQDTLRTGLKFKVKAEGNKIKSVKVEASKQTLFKAKDLTFPATIETEYGTFVLKPTAEYTPDEPVDTRIILTGVDAKAEDLARAIIISVANRQSNVISLSYKSTSIAYAKNLINSIITQYNRRAIEDKNSQASLTLSFIDNRLGMISDALASSEDDVAEYKSDNKIVDLMADTSYNFQKKGELEKQLITAGSMLEVLAMTRDFLRVPDNAYSLIPTVVDNSGLQSFIVQYNELILKRITLAETAKGSNATLKSLDQQIDAMRANILSSIDRTYKEQQIVYNNIKKQVDNTEMQLGSVPSQERQFRDIARQQEIKEQLYVFLLQRREETAMMMANALPKGIIIDEAYALNEPVGLSIKMLLILSFMLGLMIPAGLLYIKLMMRKRFESREELERLTTMPILGEICTTKRDEPVVVYEGGSSSISELFRLIRTNLQFVLGGKNERVILVTSTRSGEGKSFVAINLAASLALLGRKMLLIGMDIRKPMLESYLGLAHGRGLTELLAGSDLTVDDIIRRHPLEQSSMDIITAGPVPPNPAELLLSNRLDELFAQLRERYDYIIIDSAPVGMVSDTFTLERISDATIYVTRANYTMIRDVDFANKVFDDKRLKKMSLVLNGTAIRKGYGYGYGRIDKD